MREIRPTWGEGMRIKQLLLNTILSALIAAGLMIAFVPEGLAQTFPSQSIRVFVPSAPGAPPDVFTRIVTTELAARKRWNVVVENKPGAMGTLAGTEVHKAPPDGQAIWVVSLPQAAAPALQANSRFNFVNDFEPVVQLAVSTNVLVVAPRKIAAHSLREFVEQLKAQREQLNFASGGHGTPAHLVGELFKLQTGIKAVHVPYQTGAQIIPDLINGTVHFSFITTTRVIDLIATGQLRGLAVTTQKRAVSLREIPSVVEQGYPGLIAPDWIGFVVKAGTPSTIVAQLNSAANEALGVPNVQGLLGKLGAEPAGGTPEAFGKVLRGEVTKWGTVIRDAGIKLPN
jgi:tripartite-type tricarboxylate transporter receptor subunit TctC